MKKLFWPLSALLLVGTYIGATVYNAPLNVTGTFTNASLAGVVRAASGVFSAAELSGDATTSGSNAVSVVKVNGNTPGGSCTAPKLVITLSSSAVPTCAGDASWTGMAAGCGGSCYSNSWADFGSGLQVGSFYKDGFGFVHLRGVIAPGTRTAGTTIITMPSGYRPPTTTVIYFFTDQGTAPTTLPQRMDFTAAGVLTNTFAVNAASAYLDLEGVTYATFN